MERVIRGRYCHGLTPWVTKVDDAVPREPARHQNIPILPMAQWGRSQNDWAGEAMGKR